MPCRKETVREAKEIGLEVSTQTLNTIKKRKLFTYISVEVNAKITEGARTTENDNVLVVVFLVFTNSKYRRIWLAWNAIN